MITQTTKTFGCICGYHQDFDPFENVAKHNRLFPGVPVGNCPSCATLPQVELRKNVQMGIVLETSEMSTHETVEAQEVEALTEIERDDEGNVIKIDSGEVKQELGIVDGKPAIIETPILVEKTRELTKQEKAKKLEEASIKVDELAAKEYTP
jgi:uncharacterized Zn finger protein